jgi:hypothetical protein
MFLKHVLVNYHFDTIILAPDAVMCGLSRLTPMYLGCICVSVM